MKFIAALFATFFICFAGETSDDDAVLAIFSQINEINSQISIIKSKAADNNQTAKDNALYDAIVAKKHKLLGRVPDMIMHVNVDPKQAKNFKEKQARLESSVAKLKSGGNKNEYVKEALELEKMRLDELFFSSLINLEEIFKNGGKASQIKSSVEEALLKLQTTIYAEDKSLKDGLDLDLATKYKSEFDALELYKSSLEEILNYLRDNADLLGSNFVLSELNLSTAIEMINKKIPLDVGVNFGKVIIISAVFLFFMSFTTILSKITYWIMAKFIIKHNQDAYTKGKVIKNIKRPMLVILIAYAFEICVSLAYYPTPMPLAFASALSIAFVVSFTWLLLSVLDGYGMVLISELTKKSGRKEVINLILKIVYFIIVVIALLIVLSRLGFNVSAIIASLGIGGLAVALATKDILANFFASVMLLFDNSFSQGDWIVCGDIEGTVVEIGLRKTTIRTFDNALIFVPNSKLASDPIRNWNRRKLGRRIRMVIGVEYGAAIDQLKKCVEDIKTMLVNHPDIATGEDMGSKTASAHYRQNIVSIDDLAGYKSNLFVVIDELGDSSVNILIYCFSKTIVWGDFLAVKQDVILKIMQIVQDNGLGFAFPSQSLYIENLKDIK
jgi:mechanosensitive ion channel family protein